MDRYDAGRSEVGGGIFWGGVVEVVGCVGAIVRSPESVREKRKQDHLPASWAPLGVPELEEPGVVRPLTPYPPDPHSSAAVEGMGGAAAGRARCACGWCAR